MIKGIFNKKALLFVLAAGLTSSASVEAKINLFNNPKLALSFLAMAVYYGYKTEPSHEYDLSMEALKKDPLAWLENALGNRAIPDVSYGRKTEIGQQGRGLIGFLSENWEKIAPVLGLYTFLNTMNIQLDDWFDAFGSEKEAPLSFQRPWEA